jgi:hypothetical protein
MMPYTGKQYRTTSLDLGKVGIPESYLKGSAAAFPFITATQFLSASGMIATIEEEAPGPVCPECQGKGIHCCECGALHDCLSCSGVGELAGAKTGRMVPHPDATVEINNVPFAFRLVQHVLDVISVFPEIKEFALLDPVLPARRMMLRASERNILVVLAPLLNVIGPAVKIIVGEA